LSRQKNNLGRYVNESLTKEKLREYIDEVSEKMLEWTAEPQPTTSRPQRAAPQNLDTILTKLVLQRYKLIRPNEIKDVKAQLKQAIDEVFEEFSPAPIGEEREYGPGSYDWKFAHKPENRKKHAARNRANRAAVKSNRKSVGDGKDVHHPQGHSDSSPTQVMSQGQNRGMAGEGGRKKVPKK